MPDHVYRQLLDGNRRWSAAKLAADPAFFDNLTKGQHPATLWIGCSDSRVPANEITDTTSGEIFVHRNVANLVVPNDVNMLSVVQYAVQVLKVKQIIVCGHYGCGGIAAAVDQVDLGIVDVWLAHIREVYARHRAELDAIEDRGARLNRLTELNVIDQVRNLAKTAFVQRAWAERELDLHGWVYGFNNGLITELDCKIDQLDGIDPVFRFDFTK